MRKSLFFILLVFVAILFLAPLFAFADTIQCYSGGKMVYKRHVSRPAYTGDLFIFIEDYTGDAVIVKGDCIVKVMV